MAKKHLKPQFSDDEDLDGYLQHENFEQESDDELGKLSFGALKTAQDRLDEDEQRSKPRVTKIKKSTKPVKETSRIKAKATKIKAVNHDSESEGGEFDKDGFSDMSDGMFDDEDSDAEPTLSSSRLRGGQQEKKKRGKHAPTETSSKRKVSRIREIPGLENPKLSSSLYRDIRFDTAFGKADINKIRKDYKFLDDYRQDEISHIDKMLKDPKMRNKLNHYEVEDLEYQSKSLRSRLDSLKNRDMAQEVVKKYKEEKGIKGNFFLKKSEQRKIVQKHKFENMKASQREKVVERKRKRRLGKEFKQLEFNRPRD